MQRERAAVREGPAIFATLGGSGLRLHESSYLDTLVRFNEESACGGATISHVQLSVAEALGEMWRTCSLAVSASASGLACARPFTFLCIGFKVAVKP